jgi:hypothetical protein
MAELVKGCSWWNSSILRMPIPHDKEPFFFLTRARLSVSAQALEVSRKMQQWLWKIPRLVRPAKSIYNPKIICI